MPNLKRNRALANHRGIYLYEIAYGAVTVVVVCFFFFKVNVVDLSIRLCNYYLSINIYHCEKQILCNKIVTKYFASD